MSHQIMRGHSSAIVRNLNLRLPKAWKYIDYIFSESCKDHTAKKDTAIFLIGKALPNKSESIHAELKASVELTDSLAEKLIGALSRGKMPKIDKKNYEESTIIEVNPVINNEDIGTDNTPNSNNTNELREDRPA